MHLKSKNMEDKVDKLGAFIDTVNEAIRTKGQADVLLMSPPHSIYIGRLTETDGTCNWKGTIYRYQPLYGGAFSIENSLGICGIEDFVLEDNNTALYDPSGILFETFERYKQSKEDNLQGNIDMLNRFMQDKKRTSNMPLDYSIKAVRDIFGRALAFPVIRLTIGQNVLYVSGTIYTDGALNASVEPILLIKDLDALTQRTPLNAIELKGNRKLNQAIEMVTYGTII